MSTHSTASHAAIEEVTHLRERSFRQRMMASQPFWVTVAVLAIVGDDDALPAECLRLGR